MSESMTKIREMLERLKDTRQDVEGYRVDLEKDIDAIIAALPKCEEGLCNSK